MTHDPREALKRISSYPVCTAEGANSEAAAMRTIALEALTASPGEQEPVACSHPIEQRYGSGSLSTDWSGFLEWRCKVCGQSGRTDFPKKDASQPAPDTPPAAGWNEAIEAAVAVARKHAASLDNEWNREIGQADDLCDVAKDIEEDILALRREAPAPEEVSRPDDLVARFSNAHLKKLKLAQANGSYLRRKAPDSLPPIDESLHTPEVISSLQKPAMRLEGRPDAGGGVREAITFYRSMSEKQVYSGQHVANILETVLALSTPPAAAESNASVEARLREALKLLISDIEDYERVNNLAPSPGKNDCWQSVTRAKESLSAVGDEARKSEGGVDGGAGA